MKGGKTVRTFILTILTLAFFSAAAQEPLMPLMPELDSTQMELERRILYRQLLSGTLQTGGMLEIPEFRRIDFNSNIRQPYNFQPEKVHSLLSRSMVFAGNARVHPFSVFRNGAVFSSASYRISDKFTGRIQFRRHSVFTAPFPNQGFNNSIPAAPPCSCSTKFRKV